MSEFESSVLEPEQDMVDSEPDEIGVNIDFTEDNDLPASSSLPSSLPSSPQNIPLNKTDHDKPAKVTQVSAIQSGLKGLEDGLKPQGLFKVRNRGTKEDRNQYFECEDKRHNEWMEKHKDTSDRKKQVQIDKQRERARLRKQKS